MLAVMADVGTAKLNIEADASGLSQDLVGGVQDALAQVVKVLGDFTGQVDSSTSQAGQAAGQNLADGARTGADAMQDVSGAAAAAGSGVEQAFSQAAASADAALRGVDGDGMEGAVSGASGAGQAVTGTMSQAAASADAALRGVDGDGMAGAVSGASGAGQAVQESLSRAAGAADAALRGIDGDGYSGAVSGASGAGQTVVDTLSQAAASADSAMAAVDGDGFPQLVSAAQSAGQSVSDSLSKATNSAGGFRGAISSMADSMSGAVPSVGVLGTAIAGVAGPLAALKGGFKRLNDIERGEILFKNVGLSAEETSAQMDQLKEQVTGTAVSLSDAVSVSANFASAGVEMGDSMNNAIDAFVGLTAAAGDQADGLDQTMQKAAATGKVNGAILEEISNRGISITDYLGNSLGKTTEEIQDMASKGEISFEMLVDSVNENIGGLAKDMGETLPSMIGNATTAFATMAAALLEPIMGPLSDAISWITDRVKDLTGALTGTGEGLGFLQTAFGGAGAGMVLAGGAVTVLISAMKGLNAVMHANPIGLIVTAIGGLIGAFITLWQNVEGFRNFWIGVWDTITGVIGGASEGIGGAFDTIKDAIEPVKRVIGEVVESVGNAFALLGSGEFSGEIFGQGEDSGLVKVLLTVREVALDLWDTLKEVFGSIAATLGSVFSTLGTVFSSLWAALQPVISAIWELVKVLWPVLKPILMVVAGIIIGAVVAAIWLFIKALGIASTVIEKVAGVISWLSEHILGPLIEILGHVAGFVINVVAGAFRWFGNIVATVAGAIGTAFSWLWEKMQWLWDSIGRPIVDVIVAVFKGLWAILKWIFDVIAAIFAGMWSIMKGIWEGFGQPIADAVAAGFAWLWDKLSAIFEWISDKWGQLMDWLSEKWQDYGQPVVDKVTAGFNWLKERIDEALAVIKQLWDQAWSRVQEIYHEKIEPVINWISDKFNWLKDTISEKLDQAIDFFANFPDKIREIFADAGEWLKDAGRNIVQGIIDGVKSMFGKVEDMISDLVGTITGPFKKLLGIESPSRVFKRYGEFVGEGFVRGVESMGSRVEAATVDLAQRAANVPLPATVDAKDLPAFKPGSAPAAATPTPAPAPAPVPTITVPPVEGDVAPAVDALGELGAVAAQVQQGQVDPAMAAIRAAMAATGGQTQVEAGRIGVSWRAMAAGMVAAQQGMLNPMLAGVRADVAATGQHTAYTTGDVMSASWSAMAGAMLSTKDYTIVPMLSHTRDEMTATGRRFTDQVQGVLHPQLQSWADKMWHIKNTAVDPVFTGIRGGLDTVVGAFRTGVDAITAQWDRVREATARPVRFTIGSVFNDGLVGMWNSVSDLIGTERMAPYPIKFATGGHVRGPGGPRDDKIPALLSDGEYVINAKAVDRIGVNNLNALNHGKYHVDQDALRDSKSVRGMLNDQTFQIAASRYQGGGIAKGTQAWKDLRRGYIWAKQRNGRPYVWGGSAEGSGGADCCLTGDTMVWGPSGARRMDEIKPGFQVYSYVDGRREVHTVTAAWFSKRQDTYRIRTRNRAVVASGNHPFMKLTRVSKGSGSTPSSWGVSWSRADELRPGDLLITPKDTAQGESFESALPSGRVISLEEAWLLGLILGDGSVGDKNIAVCVYGHLRDYAARVLLGMGASSTTYSDSNGVRAYSTALARELTDAGFRGHAVSKRIPECVWSWQPEAQRAFLDGYCDADGHYPAQPDRHGERTYSSASRGLVQDVRTMHAMLGDAVSNISTNDRSGDPITINGVEVLDAKPLHTFTVWQGRRDGNVAIRRNSGIRRWIEAGEFTVAKVLDVDGAGEADTFDLEVAGSHNFLADGLVVHNSGFMSGIADVILGGNGARQWATSTFPGPQQGAWEPGLGAGFAVGISNEHTAGTIGGVEGMPAVNVESGGMNSRMKFATPDAAGADDAQFNRRFRLKVVDGGRFVPGMGGGMSLGQMVRSMMEPARERIMATARGYRGSGGMIDKLPVKVADKLTEAAIGKASEAASEMDLGPAGAGAERWRPLAKRAMAHVGLDPTNSAQVDAMIKQIATESGGDPAIAQQIHDINGTGEQGGVGLLQVIPGTFAEHRDPSLPNDRRNPFSNMVAALRYYISKYGRDLTTMWGHGHGYDMGGIMSGKGLFAKKTFEPERVLSPAQTRSFDRLTRWLDATPESQIKARATGQPEGAVQSGRTIENHVTIHVHEARGGEDTAKQVERRLLALI